LRTPEGRVRVEVAVEDGLCHDFIKINERY